MPNENIEYAFPSEEGNHASYGMPLRDYFAAKAMQAWITAGAFNDGAAHMLSVAGIKDADKIDAFIAEMAYDAADAMMEARK